MESIHRPLGIWKYNQIIGYITISTKNQDIIFELFKAVHKKIYPISSKKQFIDNTYLNGYHFETTHYNDKEIKEKISYYLKEIENLLNNKHFYVDYSVYNNFIDFIDTKKVIEFYY